MGNNFVMVAKTLYGLEEVLAKELRNLGAGQVRTGVRSVSFEGDKGFMYKANLCLRTALRILKPIKKFKVHNDRDLYRKIKEMDWSRNITSDASLAIDVTLHSQLFTHSLYVAQKAKDAIVDQFRERHGKRPRVDLDNPDLRIHLHIQQDFCTVSLDSSGASLHQRGYRIATNIAPINEVLAAGILLLSGWDGQCNFMDPMCGSGTLLIEATMIACNIPANINREGFAFEKWHDFDSDLYGKIVQACLNRTREFHHSVLGYDKAPSAVRKTGENVENANLSDYVKVERKNFFHTDKITEGPLHMVFNPPYGERLGLDAEVFYGKLGDTLKKGYPGTQAWLITSNLEALKHVGLRTSKRIKVFNGGLESRLVKYEMYEGSKKKGKQRET
ncbi:MAG: class I SAM-dependent RNA methyltransferase [Flavobacteriaceae bacterium]